MLKVKELAYLLETSEVGYVDVYVHGTDKCHLYKEVSFIIDTYSDYKVLNINPRLDNIDETVYFEIEIFKKERND